MGAEVRPGSLDDLDALRDAAASSDGVVHLAFKHDTFFAGDFAGATDADRAAIDVAGEALAGTDKPFVMASGMFGVLGLPSGVVATERDGAGLGRWQHGPDQRRRRTDGERPSRSRARRPRGPLLNRAAPTRHARQG
ncbi:hypothetical protein [Micromonospora cremea]|uniref:hypothetical protein n=1 Tax=Micromonospora cremea TaxID=709881 RepID=UPI000940AF91|nr:hypothetical protein [Micromonospora cremea]